MKTWKSYLLWEAVPFVPLLSSLDFLVIYNWDYERRLFVPSFTVGYVGPILLLIAIVMTLTASGLLFLMRLFWPAPDNRNRRLLIWLLIVPKGLCVLALLLMMLFIVWIGPAAVVMLEQKTQQDAWRMHLR